MLAACLNSAEESPDPKQDKNGNTFPGQIAQMTAISAMNPPRSLAAGGATTLLAGGSQHHYQPALPHSLQFMQDNLSGIWNQCPMSHRRIPETARANLIVSSVGSPGKYHQMCGRAIQWQRPFDDTQANLSINGGGAGNTGLMLDGVSNAASTINNTGNAKIAYVPPVDSVQEFKIVSSPYRSEERRVGKECR